MFVPTVPHSSRNIAMDSSGSDVCPTPLDSLARPCYPPLFPTPLTRQNADVAKRTADPGYPSGRSSAFHKSVDLFSRAFPLQGEAPGHFRNTLPTHSRHTPDTVPDTVPEINTRRYRLFGGMEKKTPQRNSSTPTLGSSFQCCCVKSGP